VAAALVSDFAQMSVSAAEGRSDVPRLKRVLNLGDLIFYGLVAVTPSAPATVFGLAQVKSHGHAVDTILIAMVAMVLTAISYGRMAATYPSAGSAYAYVGRTLHPYLGFLAGWAMLLDYIVTPLFCVMFGTLALMRAVPGLPFAVGAAIFAGGITWLNLQGIRATARMNQIMLAFMFLVLAAFLVLSGRWIVATRGPGALLSITPFYSPGTFRWKDVAHATSFAALTYLGFDAVTTLAEDVKNPKRNLMIATVGVCLFTGLFGGLLVYLGQLVWPDYSTYSNVDTAFIEVTGRVGGAFLFRAVSILLLVAMIGAGLTTQVGAARLLLGMGRDNLVPRRVFAHLHARRNTPNLNIWIIGIIAYLGSLCMSYEVTAEIMNFGAFLGFMGVNLAVIRQFWFGNRGASRSLLSDVLLPLGGFLFCGAIWWELGTPAKIAGSIWFVVGVVILCLYTRGFARKLELPDVVLDEP
jgi:putrescine importer